ncbi:unnamed protein product [Brachionus calyciflorus]|uniref:Uncharacterized protein n=1 Tax=Brachionus calyciflorus TaxID=104777 RepID=A0A814E6G2_9BILA|nr:unnamed protein product [Brachionus calyciflorus]
MKLNIGEKSLQVPSSYNNNTHIDHRDHDLLLSEDKIKPMLNKNKQSIPLLTTTLISPSIAPAQLLNLNSIDTSQIFVKANSLLNSKNSKFTQKIQRGNSIENNLFTNTSENSNYYFKFKFQQPLRNSNQSIQSSNAQLIKQNSSLQDLVNTSNNSLINSSSIAMNKYQEPNMAQYTKFTKNIFTETYNNSGAKMEKSPSRGSNFTSPMSSVINGTPISIVQSSNGLQNALKTERLKASPGLGRSNTIKYTKSYMETNNIAQKQPLQTHTQHFNFSRKAPNSQLQNSQQQSQESITKKDFINVLNNIQRSSSIKLGREKTSLSNYFTSLTNNNISNNKLNQSNTSVNGSITNLNQLGGFNLLSSSNNLSSLNSQFNQINNANNNKLQNFPQQQRPKHSILKANNLNLNKYLDQIVDQSTNLKVSSSFKTNRNEQQIQEIKEIPNRLKILENESGDSENIVEYTNIEDLERKEKIKNLDDNHKSSNDTPVNQHHQYLASSQLSHSNSKKGSNQNLKLINNRPISRVSYISRDINDSYAYTNVKQYIEENELMPPEKAESIRRWIKEVNVSVDEWEKRTIEINIVQE